MNEKEMLTKDSNYREGINTKEFISKLKSKWYLFLIFGFAGLVLAFVVSRYVTSKYEISNIVLVKNDSRNESLTSLFNQQYTGSKKLALTGQVGVIKSFKLNFRAVQNLKWDISIFEKGLLNDTDLYLNEPFIIEKIGDSTQAQMTPVYVKSISDDLLEVSIKEIVVQGKRKNVSISQLVRWDEPFSNQYFNFRIKKNPLPLGEIKIDQEYYIIFNNLNQLAHNYKNRLDVTLADEDSDLIYMKLKTKQLTRDVNYLNELARVYIDFGLEEKNAVADNTLRFINSQLVGITDSLNVASKDFTNFRSKNKIVNLGEEASLVVKSLEQVEREGAASKMKIEYYNNLKKYLNNAKEMKELVAPSVVGITDGSLNALVLKLSQLYSDRELLSYSAQEKNPNLISLDNTIQYTQKILRENIDNLLNNTYGEIKNLELRKQQVNALLYRLPKTEQDLVNIKRSFDLNNDLYTFLLKKRAEVGIARSSNSPDATLLDSADTGAAESIGPNKSQIILLGLFLGLSIPFITLLIGEYFDTTIKNSEEVENYSTLPLIGTIFDSKFKTNLPVIQHPNSAVAESFRSLRTNIEHFIDHSNSKAIAVHSTLVNEGKSFIAANLASSLASKNKKVLLIEGDMRNPELSALFECNRENGLSTYLNGKLSLKEIIQPTKITGLSFVAAGSEKIHSSELLRGNAFEILINEAKKYFDYIIIDSVPVGVLSDAESLGRYADANLIVVRAGLTKIDQLKLLNKLSKENIIKNLSIVLNGVHNNFIKSSLKNYVHD
jgi:tyrosine-protein kinase Etk/Wzc